MKLEFSGQIFDKYSHTKSHENPSSGSRVVPCGRADGRTDMTKLTVVFAILRKGLKTYKRYSIRMYVNMVRFAYVNIISEIPISCC